MQHDRVFMRYALGGETAARRRVPGGSKGKDRMPVRLTRFAYGLRAGTVLGSDVGAPADGQPSVEVIRPHQRPDLWDTLPAMDRRTRVFVATCPRCGAEHVLMTAKGAWSWIHRACPGHRPVRRRGGVNPTVPTQAAAEYNAQLEADDPPEGMVWARSVWAKLSGPQRRALQYWEWSDKGNGGPGSGGRIDGAWRAANFPTRQAFNSAGRGAELKLARLLAEHYAPNADYTTFTGGRRGFDATRFWADFEAWGNGRQLPGWPPAPPTPS